MHLYVYYDVLEESIATARAQVIAMQADLRTASTVVKPRLLRRVERGATWMEVYEDVSPAFESALAAAVERHGVAALTGPRHIERFADLA